jgi:hypothetical protein
MGGRTRRAASDTGISVDTEPGGAVSDPFAEIDGKSRDPDDNISRKHA